MPLWPSMLPRLPGLGLQYVAGRDGLDQRGPITSAHVLDTAQPEPWLSGGEVVLLPAELADTTVDPHRFVGRLATGGATALCLHAAPEGRPDIGTREEFADASDEQMLPLAYVPAAFPLFAVARAISAAVLHEHELRLAHAVDLHRKVVEAVLRGGGPAEILTTVGQAMEQPTLVAHDFAGGELARYDPANRLDEVTSTELSRVVSSGGRDLRGFEVVIEEVKQSNAVEAVVALILPRRTDMYEGLLLQQAATGLGLDIARNRSGRIANREKVSSLLEGATSRTASAARLRKGMERLGFPGGTEWRMVVLAGADDEIKQDELSSAVEDLRRADRLPAVGILDNWIAAILPEDPNLLKSLDDVVATRRWTGITAGVSRVKTDGTRLAGAFREASVAVSLGGDARITMVEALGVHGLVAGLREELGAPELVRSVLGPLTDPKQNVDLLETVRVYFANACRAGPTANKLGIHRHTLTYRLERIEGLTGLDPRDGKNMLAYTLAIEMLNAEGDHR